MTPEQFKIRRGQLCWYNGKDGAPAFVACHDTVYDVAGSFLWPKGRHQVLHNAGEDLTRCLKDAPHGEEFLKRFPVVGTLTED